MRFGNVTLHLVSDGVYWEDGGGLFGLVPKALWAPLHAPDDRNRLPFETRSLLVDTGAHRILVDTGYGDKLSPKERGFISLEGERRLIGNLHALGLAPADVDVVINTHLHGDHCGGNTLPAPTSLAQRSLAQRGPQSAPAVPAFPRAAYYVQRLELADASFPNERTRATYLPENWIPLQESGQLHVLSGDTRLTGEVRVVVTPGHTRGHQCVVVESAGQTALFLGDLASWPIHLERLSWIPAYDVEPLVSLETKRAIARWAVEKRVLLLFEHHPDVAAGYLHPTHRPDRFRLEPIDLD